MVVECEHVTAELLKAKEQMVELQFRGGNVSKLADIQKQHEIEAALNMAMADPLSANVGGDPVRIGTYSPRCSPPSKKINEFSAHQGEINELASVLMEARWLLGAMIRSYMCGTLVRVSAKPGKKSKSLTSTYKYLAS